MCHDFDQGSIVHAYCKKQVFLLNEWSASDISCQHEMFYVMPKMQHGLKKSRGFVALWNSKERINLTFSMRSTLVLPNEILTHWKNSVVHL